MAKFFEKEFIGKHDIASHFSRCESCRRLTLLNTYSTTCFVKVFKVLFIPIGRFRMIDECSECGFRGAVSALKYARQRKRNLKLMMDGFASDADNPDNCAHALQTLMVYNESAWFRDVQKSYGLRFETNMQIQYLIAQGLCRFGDYTQAITYCRKAIVLGAGRPAEQLMAFCHTLIEAMESNQHLDEFKVLPESSMRAYVPIFSLVAGIALYFVVFGFISMRTDTAWLVNGSLSAYSFTLDDKTYTLHSGERKQIKLRMGEHELKLVPLPPERFTCSKPLIKQLFHKQLLVINPDATALLLIGKSSGKTDHSTSPYSYGEQIRLFPELRAPPEGISVLDSKTKETKTIGLYRPDNHLKMVTLMKELGLEDSSVDYARRVLAMTPATEESDELLDIALGQAKDSEVQAFLQKGLAIIPPLLPWHVYYQSYMTIHHPDHNLEHEYTSLCKDHPDDPRFYYLLGRVVKDRATAYKFFEHAEKKGGMGGLGYHAIARDLFVHGQFRKALPYSEKALACTPSNKTFIRLNEEILLALRDFDALVAKVSSAGNDASIPELPEKTVLYLTCAGYHQKAEASAIKFNEQHIAQLPRLNAIRFYAVGNVGAYLDCLAEVHDPHVELERFLHQNRIAEADAWVSQNSGSPYWEYLVLYCAAMDQNNRKVAQESLEKAIAKIGNGTISRHAMGEMLSGKTKPSVDAIHNFDLDPQEKAVLCVALGYLYPELQRTLNELSQTYNFIPAYPQQLLKKWNRRSSIQSSLPIKNTISPASRNSTD